MTEEFLAENVFPIVYAMDGTILDGPHENSEDPYGNILVFKPDPTTSGPAGWRVIRYEAFVAETVRDRFTHWTYTPAIPPFTV